MLTKFHKSNLTLEKLQAECQAIENVTPAKLVHLQAVEVEIPVNSQNHFNQGNYQEIGPLDKITQLKFVAVTDPTKIPSIIADQLKDKFLLIFDEKLFIQDNEQEVLGFGQT